MQLDLEPHLEWVRMSGASSAYSTSTTPDMFDYVQVGGEGEGRGEGAGRGEGRGRGGGDGGTGGDGLPGLFISWLCWI